MTYLRLLWILIIRNVRQEKFLTMLSITGIALGIGLFTGVKVASDRAISSFESDIRGMNPHASHEVFDESGNDFDEHIYQDVRRYDPNCLPVIKTFGYLPELKEAIDLNGVYTLKTAQFLKPANAPPGLKGGFPHGDIDWETYYRTINGVLVSARFSERYSLKKGDAMRAFLYDKDSVLKVVGILDNSFLPANTVIMDIGNFQEYLGKTGHLSRIDLATDEQTIDGLRGRLPPHLGVEAKDDLFRNRASLVMSFRHNLQFVSLIAILVGIFLLYNTVFISVAKRRTEIGILRGLGAGRKTVVLLFASQGFVFGMIGSVLGLLIGQLAAYFSVIAVEKTISTLYSSVTISDYLLTKRDIFVALILGGFVSLAASIVPSYEASKIRPHETSREGSFEGRYRRYQTSVALAGIFLLILGLASAYMDYRDPPFPFPLFAYAGILFIIGGFTLISPYYLTVMLKILRSPTEYLSRSIGTLTIGDMNGNTQRFSLALMSVAISSSLIISLLIVIFSLRGSLEAWINRNITADIYIKPASCKANYCFYPLSGEIIGMVEGFPDVVAVDRFRGLHLDVFGKKVIAGFADVGVKRQYLHRMYDDRRYEKILQEMEGDEPVAGISEFLSLRYGLKIDDKIELDSPSGRVAFRINDVSSSYSTTSGYIYIHRKWLKTYWGLDDATQVSIYVRDAAYIDRVIAELKGRLLPFYSLEIMNNRELRDRIMDIFNKSFAITYAIEFIAIMVSLIGVVTTLLSLVIERKREISILRYLGTNWGQIRQNLVLSATITGLAGIILGVLLGVLMSLILINVVNRISFGWEIHFSIPFVLLTGVLVVVLLTTVIAGFLPGKMLKRIDPRKFISFE